MSLGSKYTYKELSRNKAFLARPPTKSKKIEDEPQEPDNACEIPTKAKVFLPYKVEFLIKDLLESELKGVKYDPVLCSSMTQDLCVKIKERTKSLEYTQHRLVSQVIIGEDTEHNVQISSRCLWNHHTDNFAAATFRNSSIYAIAVLYAMHTD